VEPRVSTAVAPARGARQLLHAVLAPFLRGLSVRASLALGVVASVLGMIASWGVGFMPSVQGSWFSTLGALRPLRVDNAGLVISSLLLVLSAAALFFAWLQLGPRAALDGGGRLMRRATILWSLPWLAAFPVMSRDVYSYAAQGRLLMLGQDPYHDAVGQMPGWLAQGSDVLWAQSSSPYGPLFLLVAEGVQALSAWRPEFYVVLFRLLAFGGVLLCLWVFPRLTKGTKVNAGWLLWIVCANPLFIYSMVASAHNDSIMVALLGCAFLAALHGKRWQALLLAAAAIAVKPIVVLSLPFLGLLLAGRNATWRTRIIAWVVTGVSVGLVLALLGAVSGLWFGWIGAMAGQGAAAFPFAPYGLLGLGLGGLVALVGGPAVGAAVQSIVYALGKVIAVGSAGWLALRRPRGDALVHTGIVLLLAVVLNPVIQPWYLFWFLPFFAARRAFHGAAEQVVILLSGVLSVWCLTDQLSLPEWVSITAIKLVTVGVGLLVLVLLVFACPAHRGVFSAAARGGRWALALAGASVTQRVRFRSDP
jgi:hypothetical protein